MADASSLLRRRTIGTKTDPTIAKLLAAFLALIAAASVLLSVLFYIRYRRRRLRQLGRVPAFHTEKRASSSSNTSYHRRTRARPSTSIHIYADRPSPPFEDAPKGSCASGPLPEIRITFPDEVDSNGTRQSGRMVTVRMGDHGVGLEPVQDTLPGYQRIGGGYMESVDLEQVGGLAERKQRVDRWD